MEPDTGTDPPGLAQAPPVEEMFSGDEEDPVAEPATPSPDVVRTLREELQEIRVSRELIREEILELFSALFSLLLTLILKTVFVMTNVPFDDNSFTVDAALLLKLILVFITICTEMSFGWVEIKEGILACCGKTKFDNVSGKLQADYIRNKSHSYISGFLHFVSTAVTSVSTLMDGDDTSQGGVTPQTGVSTYLVEGQMYIQNIQDSPTIFLGTLWGIFLVKLALSRCKVKKSKRTAEEALLEELDGSFGGILRESLMRYLDKARTRIATGITPVQTIVPAPIVGGPALQTEDSLAGGGPSDRFIKGMIPFLRLNIPGVNIEAYETEIQEYLLKDYKTISENFSLLSSATSLITDRGEIDANAFSNIDIGECYIVGICYLLFWGQMLGCINIEQTVDVDVDVDVDILLRLIRTTYMEASTQGSPPIDVSGGSNVSIDKHKKRRKTRKSKTRRTRRTRRRTKRRKTRRKTRQIKSRRRQTRKSRTKRRRTTRR